MKNLLFITPQAFHDKSNNAGAKVINYYIKKFSIEFNVTVLLSYDIKSYKKNIKENELMFENNPNIKFVFCFKEKGIINKFIDGVIKFRFYYKLLQKVSAKNYKTNGLVSNSLNKAISKLQNPNIYDVVIIEFPTLLFQSKIIKNNFQNAKLVASIHDVSFQSLERYLNCNKVWTKKNQYYSKFKKNELENLKNFDLIVVLSEKDKELIEFEIDKTIELITIQPYFDKYNYQHQNLDGICFFGSMSRSENESSMIWFIENVWSKLNNNYLKLYIVGGGVTENFDLFCSRYNNIILTGYILDPLPIFNKCYAMVVPLQFGAGVKIKTLEALASGMPLISNEIGVEGVLLNKDIEYLHCESPLEWINTIEMIINNVKVRQELSLNSKYFMKQNYNLEESYNKYKFKINELFLK